ncbi:MAG: NUDIX domain-containing protein, partial [Gemmatimonadota bacterium]
YVFYLDPKVVGCSIVETGGRIALLRRAIEPQKGKWVIPGGYVDRGEDVRAAAVRETAEECGLSIRIEELLGVYSYPDHIPVVIVFLAKVLSGQLTARDETAEAAWFPKAEIPWSGLAFRSTADALRDYCRNAERSPREV